MNRDQILMALKASMPEIKQQFGAESLALFGSYARNEQKPGTDVDILVKMDPDFSKLIALQRFLEAKLNMRVDILREGGHLTPRFYSIVGKSIVYIRSR